nr:MAG TPA: hypothetical protein [Caudoviricetes sp.]
MIKLYIKNRQCQEKPFDINVLWELHIFKYV